MKMIEGHPIAVAAERTGLSQDVLRVWERRYGAVEPARDSAGQRLYTDADIARLRWLSALTRAGRSIRTVARLPAEELERLVAEDAAQRERGAAATSHPEAEAAVSAAMGHVRKLATHELAIELRQALARFGLYDFIERVAGPLLRQVGDAWHAGQLSPAQEHNVSAAVHDLLIEGVRTLNPATGPTIVVTTLRGDRHALGAAMVAATAAAERWRVVYLGADLPTEDIAVAVELTGADALALSMVYVEERRSAARELERIRERLGGEVAVMVGGSGARVVDLPEGVTYCGSMEELRRDLRTGPGS